MAWYKRKIVVSDDTVTPAFQLTAKQSLIPNLLGMSIIYNLYALPIYQKFSLLTVHPSYYLVLPLGFRIRSPRW